LKPLVTLAFSAALLAGCALSKPDRFYVLTALPAATSAKAAAQRTQVVLKVTLPSVVDRSEMVIGISADQVAILEHERWAAPLPDLVLQTLGRDLERRRNDLMVIDRSLERTGELPIKMMVEISQLSLQPSSVVKIEAHWRMVDPRKGPDVVGSNTISVQPTTGGYDGLSMALSECLSKLADALIAQLPAS
jgi:uncharacterized protein